VSIIQIPRAFEFCFQPSRYKVAEGGRGGGKSHGFAACLTSIAYDRPVLILCAREIQLSIKDSVKAVIETYCRKINNKGFWTFTNSEVRGANGSRFIFLGLRNNPDSIKSLEGVDYVWIEEANTVSQRSLDLLIPTIRRPGSEIWFTWNRRFKTDPVDQMFFSEDGPPPGSIVRKVNYWDNPWFPDVLRAQMDYDREKNYDKYKHVWLGELLERSEASVFPNFTARGFKLPNDIKVFYGADWGFAKDPTVLLRLAVSESERTIFLLNEAYQVGCEIEDTPKLFDTVPHARRNIIIADSSRPETISYMNRQNPKFHISKAIKGKNSIEEGVKFLQNYQIIAHPTKCPNAAAEFGLYSYKIDKMTEKITNDLPDEGNHAIDAARYALEQYRRSLLGLRNRACSELIYGR